MITSAPVGVEVILRAGSAGGGGFGRARRCGRVPTRRRPPRWAPAGFFVLVFRLLLRRAGGLLARPRRPAPRRRWRAGASGWGDSPRQGAAGPGPAAIAGFAPLFLTARRASIRSRPPFPPPWPRPQRRPRSRSRRPRARRSGSARARAAAWARARSRPPRTGASPAGGGGACTRCRPRRRGPPARRCASPPCWAGGRSRWFGSARSRVGAERLDDDRLLAQRALRGEGAVGAARRGRARDARPRRVERRRGVFRSVVGAAPTIARSAAANAAGLAAMVASSSRLAGAVRSSMGDGASFGTPLSGRTAVSPLPVTASWAANSCGSETTRVGSFDASSATWMGTSPRPARGRRRQSAAVGRRHRYRSRPCPRAPTAPCRCRPRSAARTAPTGQAPSARACRRVVVRGRPNPVAVGGRGAAGVVERGRHSGWRRCRPRSGAAGGAGRRRRRGRRGRRGLRGARVDGREGSGRAPHGHAAGASWSARRLARLSETILLGEDPVEPGLAVGGQLVEADAHPGRDLGARRIGLADPDHGPFALEQRPRRRAAGSRA